VCGGPDAFWPQIKESFLDTIEPNRSPPLVSSLILAAAHLPITSDDWLEPEPCEGRRHEFEQSEETSQTYKMGGVCTERIQGRLRGRAERWAVPGFASKQVLDIIENGYMAEWIDVQPPPFRQPNHASCSEHSEFVQQAIEAGLAAGAMIRVPAHQARCVSPLGVAKNSSSDKLRLIWDGRRINAYIERRKFRMEGLHREGRGVFAKCKYGSVIDLTSAYHHLDLAKAMWTFCGFEWKGVTYLFCVLPFGLTSSPRIFTLVMRSIVRLWRSKAYKVLPFMDDFPNGEITHATALSQATGMLEDLEYYGFLVHKHKCVGVDDPLQQFRALGHIIDLEKQIFRTTPETLKRIVYRCKELLGNNAVQVRALAGAAGLIVSSWVGTGPPARIRTRNMHANVEMRLKPNESVRSRISWDRLVRLTTATKNELQWWIDNIHRFEKGMPIARLHEELAFNGALATDASATGWGAWLGAFGEDSQAHEFDRLLKNLKHLAPKGTSLRECELWARKGIEAFGSFTPQQRQWSSTKRELLGLNKSLKAFESVITGCTIQASLDSQPAVYATGGVVERTKKLKVINGGSNKEDIQTEVIRMDDFCANARVVVQTKWCPRNRNIRADGLSHACETDHYGYTLRQECVTSIERFWGHHTVDRFSSKGNCRVSSGRFNSKFFSAGCEWENSFTATDWRNEVNWAHPPYGIVGDVISKFINAKARGTLIIPDWRGAAWFPRLFVGNGHPQQCIRHMRKAWFVRDVRKLGQSDDVLFYSDIPVPPEGVIGKGAARDYDSDEDELAYRRAHLPRAKMLAVLIDCRC
jgi:hypothetical protein